MKKLEDIYYSCIFANSYPNLASRINGKFAETDLSRRKLKNVTNSYSFLKIKITELNYILEILRDKNNRNIFQIRIFIENTNNSEYFILGREYVINNPKRSLTNIFINVLDDVNNHLKNKNSVELSLNKQINITEEIISHMWFS